MKMLPSAKNSVLTLVLLSAVASLVWAGPIERIVGGWEVSIEALPHVASVRINGSHICGGTIIERNAILTAASCLIQNGEQVSHEHVSVRVGSINQFAGGKLLKVSAMILHSKFSGLQNNLAILILSTRLEWTDRIQSVPLASQISELPEKGEKVDVAGWGFQTEGITPWKLNFVELKGMLESDCKKEYAAFDDSLLCLAHDKDEGGCYGDIGNGAVFQETLVGVSSFLIGSCGGRYSDMFTNVAHYYQWINSVLQQYQI